MTFHGKSKFRMDCLVYRENVELLMGGKTDGGQQLAYILGSYVALLFYINKGCLLSVTLECGVYIVIKLYLSRKDTCAVARLQAKIV